MGRQGQRGKYLARGDPPKATIFSVWLYPRVYDEIIEEDFLYWFSNKDLRNPYNVEFGTNENVIKFRNDLEKLTAFETYKAPNEKIKTYKATFEPEIVSKQLDEVDNILELPVKEEVGKVKKASLTEEDQALAGKSLSKAVDEAFELSLRASSGEIYKMFSGEEGPTKEKIQKTIKNLDNDLKKTIKEILEGPKK